MINRADNPYRTPADTTPARRVHVPIFVTNTAWTWATVIALGIGCLGVLASMWMNLERIEMGGVENADPSTDAAMELFQHRDGLLTDVMIAHCLLTAVLWSVWTFRSYRNLIALGERNPRASAHSAWIWYWVPIAGLWMPYRFMREMWQKSVAQTSSAAPVPIGAVPRMVPVWWASWVITSVFDYVFAIVPLMIPAANSMVIEGQLGLITDAFIVAASVLAGWVVLALHRRQRTAYAQQMTAQQTKPQQASTASSLAPDEPEPTLG